jgi:hypothetical protein
MNLEQEFNWWVAIALLFGFILYDFLYAIYYIFVSRKMAFMAANTACALYIIGSVSTIAYLGNYLYLVPIILGSYIGTYVAVKYFSDIGKAK